MVDAFSPSSPALQQLHLQQLPATIAFKPKYPFAEEALSVGAQKLLAACNGCRTLAAPTRAREKRGDAAN